MFRKYYLLTKPGIIRGNLFTAGAGFLLASRGHIHGWDLLAALAGTALIIGCGCVLNNYIDRGIDAKMTRTQKRALVQGTISARAALTYAAVVGALGFAVLSRTNWLTVLVGAIGLFSYVVVYGVAKRRTVHGTVIGSVSGAIPPVAGYTAASGHLDGGALILFLILTFWQMPHFYAIAMYRLKDYTEAGLPVLPRVKGMRAAKIQIMGYIAAYLVAVVALWAFGYTGYAYLVISTLLGLWWFRLGLKGFSTQDDTAWAKKMFLFSLVVITLTAILISIDSLYTFTMILLFHIAVALSSLAYTTYIVFAPTRARLRGAYTLAGLTLASGTYLVVSRPTHIMQACITGIVYLSAIAAGIVLARNRLLAAERASNR
jgi:heme o synthase